MTYTDTYQDQYGATMSRFGVDYSFSPPTVAQLKAAGVTFCCRYVGIPSSGKNLTLTEADALQHAGIDLVANYEGTKAGWMSGGRQAGVDAAKAAVVDAVRLGMPPDRPIYFSADYNATFDQYKTQIKPCLEGAAGVIGTHRVGIYGGLEQVDWAFGDGVAPWVWQTFAWSYGQWSSHSRIQQYKNGQTLGSGTVDYDRAIVADFGQWRAPQEDPMALIFDTVDQFTVAVRKAVGLPTDTTVATHQDVVIAIHGGPGRNSLDSIAAQVDTLTEQVGTAWDPAALAALLAGQLEIVGIQTDTSTGIVSVQFGPKPA